MTLYHFGNCVALVYVPYYLTYKYSGLCVSSGYCDYRRFQFSNSQFFLNSSSEYGAFWKVVQAGFIYVFTQLCKMLLLATFFPDTESSAGESFNVIAEFFRCSVDFADLAGLMLVLSRIPGKGHSKLITAGLGWATAEVILSRGLLLWFGARGTEFSWLFIQKCLESNILLVQHLTTATLIWLFSRHDLSKTYRPLVIAMLLAINYKGLWLDGALLLIKSGPWLALALKALVTLVMGAFSMQVYSGLAQGIGI